MKCNPLVSVVMPVYNSEKYIKESIESVLGQTYINYELIIVNDASTDSSMKIVEELSKTSNKIRIVHLLYNQGVSAARNIGIKNAVGEYIAFIDSDDIWLENKLEEQLDFMISNNLKFSFTAYEILHCGTQRPNTLDTATDTTASVKDGISHWTGLVVLTSTMFVIVSLPPVAANDPSTAMQFTRPVCQPFAVRLMYPFESKR